MPIAIDTGFDTDIGRVRALVGDDIDTDPQLSNEKIVFFLQLEGNDDPLTRASTRVQLYRAAARAAAAIGAHYARVYNLTIGQNKVTADMLLGHYLQLAKDLRAQANVTGGGPRMSGRTLSGKLASQDDTDQVQPFFSRSMQTEPGTGPDDHISGTSVLDPSA